MGGVSKDAQSSSAQDVGSWGALGWGIAGIFEDWLGSTRERSFHCRKQNGGVIVYNEEHMEPNQLR